MRNTNLILLFILLYHTYLHIFYKMKNPDKSFEVYIKIKSKLFYYHISINHYIYSTYILHKKTDSLVFLIH